MSNFWEGDAPAATPTEEAAPTGNFKFNPDNPQELVAIVRAIQDIKDPAERDRASRALKSQIDGEHKSKTAQTASWWREDAPATTTEAPAVEQSEAKASFSDMFKRELMNSLPGGMLRGAKNVVDTGAEALSRLGGPDEYARVRAMNAAGKQEFAEATKGSAMPAIGQFGGEILATLPLVSAAGAGATAAGLPRLGQAISTFGASSGAPVKGALAQVADLGTRIFGGAVAGGMSAGAVDPDKAGTGAVIGAALPPALEAVGYGARALSSAVMPWFSKGQDKVASKILTEAMADPTAAAANLRSVSKPLVPGSEITGVAAAGDTGLAGLSRTMQNRSKDYQAATQARTWAQNAARTEAIEGIAGNIGKLDLAKAARDATTGPMREQVLTAAGQVPTAPLLRQLDDMLASPGAASEIAEQALTKFRNRIEKFTRNGAIDARALYEIRKDIGLLQGGKLQGEAGNLRYASGQLSDVKHLIDDAIDLASRSAQKGSGHTWRKYLQTYTEESIPINQMEELEKILKRVTTGTTDAAGNPTISSAKLNTLLKNEAKELRKSLSDKQLQVLRNVAADAEGNAKAVGAGRASGSNTAQNLYGDSMLTTLLGDKLGRSTLAQGVPARVLDFVGREPNRRVMERVEAALLDPKELLRLTELAAQRRATPPAVGALSQLGYRGAPLLGTQE